MAISIIGGLRDSLDHKADVDLTLNLDNLYEYMSRRLLQANVESSIAMLDEVYDLMMEIKIAWDAIGQAPLSGRPLGVISVNTMQKQAI